MTASTPCPSRCCCALRPRHPRECRRQIPSGPPPERTPSTQRCCRNSAALSSGLESAALRQARLPALALTRMGSKKTCQVPTLLKIDCSALASFVAYASCSLRKTSKIVLLHRAQTRDQL